MPKINQEEYEVLKELDDKWKWIARDKDGTLVMGAGKNERYLDRWFPPVNVGDSLVVDETNAVKDVSEWGNLFQFIQWEDEEPCSIAELIEEYEKDYKGSWEHAIEFSGEVFGESEETEVKTKQELIDKWESAIGAAEFYGRGKEDRLIEYMRNFVDDLNQLDEPEVLSQEFIDKYKVDYDNWMPAVPIVHLQNLLVPKQELPVIPKFVADWIEKYIEYGYDLYPALKKMENNSRSWKRIYDWYRKNTHTFVNAYLTGKYEVEKEQKHYVLTSSNKILLTKDDGEVRETYQVYSWIKKRDKERYQLTEQEIKGYDERYWPFAVKVEEIDNA